MLGWSALPNLAGLESRLHFDKETCTVKKLSMVMLVLGLCLMLSVGVVNVSGPVH
jgi:hypothetical protein